MRMKLRGALFAAAVSLILIPVAQAKEVRVKPGEVPAAVMDSLNTHYHAATFIGFSKETENSSTFFEAEMKIDGRHVDALLDTVGVVREEETTLAASELPAAVLTSLGKSEYAGAKIKSAERHLVPGSKEEPTYELHVTLNGGGHELVFTAEGRLRNNEEADEKD